MIRFAIEKLNETLIISGGWVWPDGFIRWWPFGRHINPELFFSLHLQLYKFSAARKERRNIKSKHLNTFAFQLMTKWMKRRHANQRFTILYILYWSKAVIKFHIYDCSPYKNSNFIKTTWWCLCLRSRFGFFCS